MNPQSTSFIPQRPSTGHSPKKMVRKVYVFTYLSYILFFGTIMSVFAILAYGYILDTQVQKEKDELVAQEALFNDSEMASIKKFDTQLQTATDRMDLHLSILPIFESLERSVSQFLVLEDFKYTRENDSAPKIEISGQASVINSLLFQREVLSQVPILAGSEFTSVSVTTIKTEEDTANEEEGQSAVPFSLSKTIDLSLLKYQPPVIVPEVELSASDDGEQILSEDPSLGEADINNDVDQ